MLCVPCLIHCFKNLHLVFQALVYLVMSITKRLEQNFLDQIVSNWRLMRTLCNIIFYQKKEKEKVATFNFAFA